MAVKHAIKSTEFYLSAFAILMLGVNLFWPIPDEVKSIPAVAASYANVNNACTVIGIVVIVALYIYSRSIVKEKDAAIK